MIRFPFAFFFASLLLALAGCNDTTLSTFPGENPPPLDDDDDDDDGHDDDDATPDDGGDPYDDGTPDDDDDPVDDDDATDDDPGIDEPDPWLEDCPPDGILADDFEALDGSDEIYVLSWGPTEAVGTLWAPGAGIYAVYDTLVYESGASQTNESGFIRMRNNVNPDGTPLIANCGLDYIVQDSDNSGAPPAPLIYIGTFELVAGANEVTLYHYCPLFRDGYCPSFHIGDAASEDGCQGGGPNSIHFKGEGICLVPR